jgi:DNA-binding winged helix-turn-helix (wHTH) protein
MVRGDRSVDVFVRKLRQKLEQASPAWRYVHTHFGVGYRFSAERADAPAPARRPAAAREPAESAQANEIAAGAGTAWEISSA